MGQHGALANQRADGKGEAARGPIWGESGTKCYISGICPHMVPAASLSRERFALLFAVMLVAASGNTAMQSLMPSGAPGGPGAPGGRPPSSSSGDTSQS